MQSSIFSRSSPGEHKEGLALMLLTLILTGAFVGLVWSTQADQLHGLQLASLASCRPWSWSA